MLVGGDGKKDAEGAGRVSVLCLSKEQAEIGTHFNPGMDIRHQGELENLLREGNTDLHSVSAWKAFKPS